MQLDNSLKKYLHELRRGKKQKRRFTSFITAMSVFVSTGVFWQLRGIGTAMTDNTLDMAAPLSAADGSLCETDEVWESTLPELTDELAENTALIAASQSGYTENKQNYILGDDGTTHKNYSRYGAWFGNPYGDWNTMFTCFCLHYAGAKETDIPFSSGCWAWSLKLEEKGILSPLNKGSPKRGDVLLLDTDLDGKADRSGIITGISSDSDPPYIIVIEGQIDGAVAECRYSPEDEHIAGYVSVVTPENEDSSPMEFSAESESGIKIHASAEHGIFPEDTEMLAEDVPRDEALEKAAEALGEGTADIGAVAVDITFISHDGTELEPADNSKVHVEIILPDEQKLSGEEFNLFHIADSGGAEKVENADVSESGAVFDAESFSMYVMTSNGYQDKDYAIWLNGQPVRNTADSPYVMYVGDQFILKTEALWYSNGSDSNGWQFTDDGQTVLGKSELLNMYGENRNGVDYRICENRYTASSVGTAAVHVVTGENWENEAFYVKVVERPQIYVNTALGEIHKDYVHEYLNIHRFKLADHPDRFIYDENGKPLYIKNGDSYYTWNNYDRAFLPYRIGNGDVVELVAYGTPYDDFYIASQGSHTDTGALQKVGDTVRELVTEGEHKGQYRISAKFKGINYNESSERRSCIGIGGDYFYVTVTENNDIMTHADIEIADGGSYKVEKNVIHPDGSVTKTITEYAAYVSDVNECNIYDVSDNVVQTFRSEHYYRHGSPGEAQYELSSNYIKNDNPQAWQLDNGDHVDLRGDKNFKLSDAQKAKFDVKLQLHPTKETVQEISSSGQVTSSSEKDISGQESIELSSVIFDLGRQDVVDAYNKCPVHTGLDFTIKASLNEVLQETLPIYTLPSTGGSGVVPYMITGSAIIVLSFAALLLWKRKEDK